MKVEAILAHDMNYAIGKGDDIPWHHSGDFKRFKEITTGHNLLMGAKTFLGIARNHFSKTPGLQVLPGRKIFILGSPRQTLGDMTEDAFRSVYKRGYGSDWVQLVHELLTECRAIGIDKSNFRIINEDASPYEILARIEMNYLQNGETLFVAGGAKTYDKYLPFATKIHETIIQTTIPDSPENVKLTQGSIDLIESTTYNWSSVSHDGDEVHNGLTATYRTHTL